MLFTTRFFLGCLIPYIFRLLPVFPCEHLSVYLLVYAHESFSIIRTYVHLYSLLLGIFTLPYKVPSYTCANSV